MDFVIIMVVLGLVVTFVTAPLRRLPGPGQAAPGLDGPDAGEPQVQELESARDAKLRELRDAELDHRTGKLSDADYSAIDGTLRAEANEILRALDQVRGEPASHGGQDRLSPDTIIG